jgi:hypothetical protein
MHFNRYLKNDLLVDTKFDKIRHSINGKVLTRISQF